MNKFHYQSPFKTFIKGMIREKRSLGYKYVSSARILYRFDQFCQTYGCDDAVITHDLVHAWIHKAPNEALATLHNRACVLRQLALYMTRLGIPSYVLPKKALPKVPGYSPYIFSDQEIAALLQQADACHYRAEVPLRHHIMPLLFRLLYGCGLRISEALNLRVQDVDLHTGVLTILDGKFNKDRWVPMCPENTQRCCDYVKVVHLFSDPGDYFFPAPGGQALTKGNVYKNFRRFLWQARISHGGWGKGPRLHDTRHHAAFRIMPSRQQPLRFSRVFSPTYGRHRVFKGGIIRLSIVLGNGAKKEKIYAEKLVQTARFYRAFKKQPSGTASRFVCGITG